MPTVDHYISHQPQSLQVLLITLRNLILETVPKVKEDIKWNIPFYTYQGIFCYLNPLNANSVALGFCNGSSLAAHPELLSGHGKLVRHVVLQCSEPVPVAKIKALLYEAQLVNEQGRRSK